MEQLFLTSFNSACFLHNFESDFADKKMSNFKDKLQVFFLGLLLGLLLGGGFFLFKLDQYVKELSIYKSFSHSKDQTAEHISDKDEKNNEKINSKYKPLPHSDQPQTMQHTDSLSSKKANFKAAGSSADSLKNTDSVSFQARQNEEIVLRKDLLLNSRSIEILNMSPVASNSTLSKDSLAAKLAGVREEHPANSRQFCSLEFWTSPLNYKGYKMNRNKIVLYGFNGSESLKVYKLDEEIYLQEGSQVFHLDNTNEFHPYDKVSSEAILSKLK